MGSGPEEFWCAKKFSQVLRVMVGWNLKSPNGSFAPQISASKKIKVKYLNF